MSDEIYVERASATGGAAEASLEEFLAFERLLADLSARFANVSIVQVETEIDSALNQLQEFLGFDRSNFFEFTGVSAACQTFKVAAPRRYNCKLTHGQVAIE